MDNKIAPLFVHVWPQPLGSIRPHRAFRWCRLLVLVFNFSPSKCCVCPKKEGKMDLPDPWSVWRYEGCSSFQWVRSCFCTYFYSLSSMMLKSWKSTIVNVICIFDVMGWFILLLHTFFLTPSLLSCLVAGPFVTAACGLFFPSLDCGCGAVLHWQNSPCLCRC